MSGRREIGRGSLNLTGSPFDSHDNSPGCIIRPLYDVVIYITYICVIID